MNDSDSDYVPPQEEEGEAEVEQIDQDPQVQLEQQAQVQLLGTQVVAGHDMHFTDEGAPPDFVKHDWHNELHFINVANQVLPALSLDKVEWSED